MRRKFWLLTLVFALFCLGLGLAVVRHKNQPAYGQSATFWGKFTCLEHKDQNGLQTAECSGGFTNGSKVYEINSEDYYKANPDLSIGADEYEITGILQPPGNFYASDGIIKITNLKLAK